MFSLSNRTFPNRNAVLNDTEKDLDYLRRLRRKSIKREYGAREFNNFTEYYNFIFYVRSLAYHNQLDFPMHYAKSEGPDFIINNVTGVEISRITDNEYQSSLKNFEIASNDGLPIEMICHGNGPEEWAIHRILETIELKERKLPDYRKKARKIVLLLKLEQDLAVTDEEYLFEHLNKMCFPKAIQFDEVSIFAEGKIFQLSNQSNQFKILDTPRYLLETT